MHTAVLAQNNRLKHLYHISDLYDDLVAAAKGEVRAKITTAQGLEPEELDDIKAGLSKLSFWTCTTPALNYLNCCTV